MVFVTPRVASRRNTTRSLNTVDRKRNEAVNEAVWKQVFIKRPFFILDLLNGVRQRRILEFFLLPPSRLISGMLPVVAVGVEKRERKREKERERERGGETNQ
jgi:hypothetical protein